LVDKLKDKDFSLQLDEDIDNNDGHLIYWWGLFMVAFFSEISLPNNYVKLEQLTNLK
jgi:hypothetical protein